MPSAGLAVDDAIMENFRQVKMKTGSLDWITFKMSDDKKRIVMDSYFPKTDEDKAAFEEDKKNRTREENFLTRVWPGFVAEMKSHSDTKGADGKTKKPEPRFAVLNSFFDHKERKQDKLLFFAYIPENCSAQQKMIFSSSKDSVVAKLEGLHSKFNFTEASEFNWPTILNTIAA